MSTPPPCLSTAMLREAERHLCRTGEVMARLVATHGACLLAERRSTPFRTLARSIIGQQLSVKAAGTIEARVLALVPDFSPLEVVGVPLEALRGAGLSAAKARYLRELAARVTDGRLELDALRDQPDEEVIAVLTSLPGIGHWTAEMYLIFGLKRPDVLSVRDAGLRRAVHLLYGEETALEAVGASWRPYRSVASWYLWRHLD